jgi:hypothetical protein
LLVGYEGEMKRDGILQFCRLSFKKKREKNDKKETKVKRRKRVQKL